MAIIPTLRCSDLLRSVAFYTEVLDFTVRREWSDLADPGFAWLEREGHALHLSSHAGDGAFGQAVVVEVSDVDAAFDGFRLRGLHPGRRLDSPVHRPPLTQIWGTREVYVEDPDGHTPRFTQR